MQACRTLDLPPLCSMLHAEQGDSAATFKRDVLQSGGGLCRPQLVDALVVSE